jgi:hypothetical protein
LLPLIIEAPTNTGWAICGGGDPCW